MRFPLCYASKSTTLFDWDVRHATKLLFSSPLNPLPDSDEQMYRKKQMCNTADLIRKCVRFAIIFKLALLAQPLHSTNLLLYNETSPKNIALSRKQFHSSLSLPLKINQSLCSNLKEWRKRLISVFVAFCFLLIPHMLCFLTQNNAPVQLHKQRIFLVIRQTSSAAWLDKIARHSPLLLLARTLINILVNECVGSFKLFLCPTCLCLQTPSIASHPPHLYLAGHPGWMTRPVLVHNALSNGYGLFSLQ